MTAAVIVVLAGGKAVGTDVHGAVTAEDGLGEVIGPAPAWPFRGIVNIGPGVLQYWNTDTGELTEVRLGTLPYCPSVPAVTDSHVLVSAFTLDGPWVDYSVPWGDEAYPQFAPVEGTVFPRQVSSSFLTGKLEVSFAAERLRVATPEREAYYLTHPGGPVGLALSDAASGREHEDDDIWGDVVELDGTDGYHYGFRIVHAEPACQAEDFFIVAGDTGKVVACGWSYGGGATLVMPPGFPGLVDRFELPLPVGGDECERSLDLRRLAILQTAEEAVG